MRRPGAPSPQRLLPWHHRWLRLVHRLRNGRRRAVGCAVVGSDAGALYRNAAANCGRLCNFHDPAAAVFHAHTDLEDRFLAYVFFNRIAGKTTANGTEDRCYSPAIAVPDLVAQYCAQDTTGNSSHAGTGWLGGAFNGCD